MSTNETEKAGNSPAKDHWFSIFMSSLAATSSPRIEMQRALWVDDESAVELATVRAQLAEAITQRDGLQRQLKKAVADNNAYKGARLSFENGELVVTTAWMGELVELRQQVERLTTQLKTVRAQRDATQRALHKANHDNDELRRQVAAPKATGGGRSVTASADLKRLFHGGEGHYYWVD
jgi:phage shock protein A